MPNLRQGFTPEIDQDQAGLDANNERGNAKLQKLIQEIPLGYQPTPAELQLLNGYGYRINDSGEVEKMSFWDINKSAILAAAGMAGGGIAGGLGAFGGGAAGAAGAGIPQGAGLSAAGMTPGLIGGAGAAGGAAAPLAATPLFGAGTAAGATPGAAASAGGAAATGGGGAAKTGMMSKIFGKGGLDPTMLTLGLLSMVGGDGGPKSYEGTSADPVQTLTQALNASKGLMNQIGNKGPAKLRSSVVPAPPAPISLPGIPFQIGGGLGRDPALDDPTLLQGRDPMNPLNPIVDQAVPRSPSNPTRRRTQ